MDIVIVAQYMTNIADWKNTNSRFLYLAQMLKQDNVVEIVTTDFYHAEKCFFKTVPQIDGIRITMCHEPGYPKNVCIKRIISHKVLADNIKMYLLRRKRPDVVYAAVPSLDVAEVCADYCTSNKVKFVIDIQDLWPEAFKMVFNIPFISDAIFYPMKKQADKIYAAADHVIAVSKSYAKRAMSVNKKCTEATVVYLGTEKETFDKYASGTVKKTEDITIGYVGSLSESYDLVTVINALSRIETSVKLLVMGDGPLRKKIKEYAQKKKIQAEFTGMLAYPQMVERLMECDIAVNPIHKGSAGSVINKVNDYAMAGLPVINTQENKEYQALLEKFDAGINCECENEESLYLAIKRLVENPKERNRMSQGSRKLGETYFDRATTYQRIVYNLADLYGGGVKQKSD